MSNTVSCEGNSVNNRNDCHAKHDKFEDSCHVIIMLCYHHVMLCYSAHSPLGLFSGQLHQVLCLRLPKLPIFTTIEYLFPSLCLS